MKKPEDIEAQNLLAEPEAEAQAEAKSETQAEEAKVDAESTKAEVIRAKELELKEQAEAKDQAEKEAQEEAKAQAEADAQAEEEALALALLEAKEEEQKQLQKVLNNSITINGWSAYNNMVASKWKDELNYNHLIYTFLLSNLKKNEGLLSWIIICISTCASTLSLIQLDDSEYEKYSIYLKVTLSTSSLCTTLIAAWLKKKNYIDRINTIDRYVQSLNQMITELKDILSQIPQDRINFLQYRKKYQKKIIDLLANEPQVDPLEYKKSIYILTKYYPELTRKQSPWYKKKQLTSFSVEINNSYKILKYSSFCRKLYYCYYCLCKCCQKKYKNQNLDEDYLDKINDSTYPDPESINNPPVVGEYGYYDTRIISDKLKIPLYLVKTGNNNSGINCYYSSPFLKENNEYMTCIGTITEVI